MNERNGKTREGQQVVKHGPHQKRRKHHAQRGKTQDTPFLLPHKAHVGVQCSRK